MNFYEANRAMQAFCEDNKVERVQLKFFRNGQDFGKAREKQISDFELMTVYEGQRSEIEHKDLRLFIPHPMDANEVVYTDGFLQWASDGITEQVIAII